MKAAETPANILQRRCLTAEQLNSLDAAREGRWGDGKGEQRAEGEDQQELESQRGEAAGPECHEALENC